MMDIQLMENVLKPEDFISLRVAAGFIETPLQQAENALRNGLFSVVAICDETVIGMGRLVGDGIMYWYIQDVVVLPEYQGNGIGKAIIKMLINYAENNSLPETKATIGLMAAKDKESFYEKLGFSSRPNNSSGAGMTMKFIATNL